jgi:VanZ family protein
MTLFSAFNDLFGMNMTRAQMISYTLMNEFYIRKAAHITEYFLLALTVMLPLYVNNIRGQKQAFITTVFCIGYAALDEFHQYFSAGRSPQFTDVCVDSIGIILSVLIVRLVSHIRTRRRIRKNTSSSDAQIRQFADVS